MPDNGADDAPLVFDAVLCNALSARLVQGLLHVMHKYEVRARQSAP
ncbi:hypothetical protein OEG79_18650 [Pseudomonas sp. Z8(2022)]|nr:hypothetical protein [Pseudomonas sp. Z8(2022)]UYP30047.1 hypothetical protein OEG79_18650 [Pseudomonas sp. Z8(2022)]